NSTGISSLFLFDNNDTTGRTVSMYDGKITGLAPADIEWSDNRSGTNLGGVNFLQVDGGSGSNTFYVYGTSPLYDGTFLAAGSGNDTVNVRAPTGGLIVYNAAGTDTVVVGGKTPLNAGVTLEAINGLVDVYGDGSTHLTVDDSGDTLARSVSMTSLNVTGLS